jgi:phosphofructokinase-like protein
MRKRKLLVLTGGGDCPGLNAVIRALVRRSQQEQDFEVWGSIEAFNGILRDPMELMLLDDKAVSGIHFRGGTILKTTNKGGPFEWPIRRPDGTWYTVDRSEDLKRRLEQLGIECTINIGGDGSQRISQQLHEMGIPVIGVPKTIDNDLSSTDMTFGFQTAVQIATEAVDKLVTTAASHNRLMVVEVMGRDAGWIALSAAIGGGADVCLIPEIPFDLDKVAQKLHKRCENGKAFSIMVVAEGAMPAGGEATFKDSGEIGYQNRMLGGVAHQIQAAMKDRVDMDSRVVILGHLQRGGIPIAFDRVLAARFGVHAFEMALRQDYGEMVVYTNNNISSVPIAKAIETYNYVSLDSGLVQTARGMGICLGD